MSGVIFAEKNIHVQKYSYMCVWGGVNFLNMYIYIGACLNSWWTCGVQVLFDSCWIGAPNVQYFG